MTVSVGGTEFGTGYRTQRNITYHRRLVLPLVPIPEDGLRNPQEGSDPTFGEVASQPPLLATSDGFRVTHRSRFYEGVQG